MEHVSNKLTPSKMTQLLEWGYVKAIDGIPGTPSAKELAEDFLSKHNSVDSAINSLIKWQNTKAATSGFVTGLGGIITLPVAIPANIASVIYIQLRMVAAIALMRGYDLKSDQVKTLVFVSLTGQGALDLLKEFGIKAGTQFLKASIRKIPFEVIKQINKAVGFRLVTKFGSTGVINLGKVVPLLGGIVGGTVDALGTNTIGKVAKNQLFLDDNTNTKHVV